jgi:hypothetical protein
MSRLVYCYTCNVQHPLEEMRQVLTGKGKRWRCIRTIEGARQAQVNRQAFGVQTTAKNKADASAKARRMVNPEFESRS